MYPERPRAPSRCEARLATDAAGQASNVFANYNYGDASADGRYVVFVTDNSNLVSGDVAGSDVFRKDTLTGDIVRVNAIAERFNENGLLHY